MDIYDNISSRNKKIFAVLVDPDKGVREDYRRKAVTAQEAGVDYILVGGSLLTNNSLDVCVTTIKENCSIPVILFPGSTMQIHDSADGILLLSLISGRNAEMLIGKHVIAAPYLKKTSLEIIPAGYMLIENGRNTSVTYMSNTMPIPGNKDDIALCTAMAGEMLGLRMIYMDAGSGADKPVSSSMVAAVKHNIDIPLIVGGGINTPEKATDTCKAGADMIVVGNAIEKDHQLIQTMADAVHSI